MEIEVVDDAGNEHVLVLGAGRIQVLKAGRLGSKEVMSRSASVAGVNNDTIVVDDRVFTPTNPGGLESFDAALQTSVATEQDERPEPAGQLPVELRTPVDANGQRWQYAVVNVGALNTAGRMASVLGEVGENGWELITVFDEQSNWIESMEKGFMLFRRTVPADVHPARWVVVYRG